MKFPTHVLLQSVAERRNDDEAGLEFVQELGHDDAGAQEMLLIVFKHQDKYYRLDLERIEGHSNLHESDQEIDCPEVIRKEIIHHYWAQV